MSDLRICHECEDAYCSEDCCNESCIHQVMCPPCFNHVGCWICADDAAGERGLSWLREA